MNLPDNYAVFFDELKNRIRTARVQVVLSANRELVLLYWDAEAYPEPEIVKQLVSQIPWGHIMRLIQTVKDSDCRNWYILQTIQNGWSRSILEMQIENDLYHRQGKSLTNFERTLPPPQSDFAQQITKDPYIFDFLSLRDDYNERVLEQGLIVHVQRFLLELGAGFAFVGRQVNLEVGGEDFSMRCKNLEQAELLCDGWGALR